MSIREIARTLHHSRRKIREAIQESEPQPYTRLKPVKAPKPGPFQAIIDEILKAFKNQEFCSVPASAVSFAPSLERRLLL